MPTSNVADFGEEAVLVIKIKRSLDLGRSVYDATRAAWRLDRDHAEQADWIVAASQGEILDVFVADRWLDAFHPELEHLIDPSNDEGRSGFVGRPAPEHVRRRWVGKTLPPHLMKPGAANPIQYDNM